MAAPSKVTLKLLVDKKANKVLFAEAGKEAVDFLCSVLTLPVGTVISLLYEQGMVGCLQNLYQSIENLDDNYILPNQHKDTVLKPMAYNSVGQASQFLLTQKKSEAMKLYSCLKNYDECYSYYLTSVRGTKCPSCNKPMTADLAFVEGEKEAAGKVAAGGGGEEGGFVKGVVTYMLMDDLVVSPMSTITGITLLTRFNVKDVGALEEKVVDLDMAKGKKEAAGKVAAGGGGGGEGGFVKGVVTYKLMDDLVVSPLSTITGITLLTRFNVKDVGALEEKVVDLDMARGLKLLKTSFKSKNVLTEVFL